MAAELRSALSNAALQHSVTSGAVVRRRRHSCRPPGRLQGQAAGKRPGELAPWQERLSAQHGADTAVQEQKHVSAQHSAGTAAQEQAEPLRDPGSDSDGELPDDLFEDGDGSEVFFSTDDGWKVEAWDADDASDLAEAIPEELPAAAARPSDGPAALEALLHMIPTTKLRKLQAWQAEADQVNAEHERRMRRKASPESAVQGSLRIICGTAANRRLSSPPGLSTRPMMEKVRAATFSMLQALSGGISGMPAGSRWLDLFAGTGAVGLEALSRGCRQCHFVEMDPAVTKKYLGANLASCGFEGQAVMHTVRAEDFLRRTTLHPQLAGGAFDFISVCPPYEAVSYEELYELLSSSPLLHEHTLVVVEYAKRLGGAILDDLGPLVKVRVRKYGRTFLAVYGPPFLKKD